jgi:hypothetical protein
MSKFDIVWQKTERIAIYVILIIFILLQFIAIFIPAVSGFMDGKGTLLMIVAVILAIFRYIDKNIVLPNKNEITQITKFTSDLISILRKPKYKEIKIFANSSLMCFQAISESEIEIDTVKLLVKNCNNMDNILFPSEAKGKQDFVQDIDRLIEKWEKLYENGKIKNLQICFYPFNSILHFMIIDNEILHFGLLKPIKEFPGSELNGSYIVNSYSKNGKELINSFYREFDSIYSNFSIHY